MAHKVELVFMVNGDFDVSSAKSIFVETPNRFRQKGALIREIGNGLVVVNQYSSLVYSSDIEFEESVYQAISSFVKRDAFAPHVFSTLRQVCGEVSIRLKCIIAPDLRSSYEPRFAMDTYLVKWLADIEGELVVDFVLAENSSGDIQGKDVN